MKNTHHNQAESGDPANWRGDNWINPHHRFVPVALGPERFEHRTVQLGIYDNENPSARGQAKYDTKKAADNAHSASSYFAAL
jgi:hypothetical protein